jgi:hypothetical protein
MPIVRQVLLFLFRKGCKMPLNNPSSAVIFNEVNPNTAGNNGSTPGSSSAWTDVTLSNIPANKSCVMLLAGTSGDSTGCRIKGSALSRTLPLGTTSVPVTWVVLNDASSKIQIYDPAHAVQWQCIGYF